MTRGETGSTAAVTGVVAFLLAFATRTRDFGGDDTVFAMTVEGWLRGRTPASELFDVYHLLHDPLVALVSLIVRSVWPAALVLDVGAGVSATFAGVTVALVVWLLLRTGSEPAIAVASGGIVAVCGGMWNIATHNEVYTMAAAAVALWLVVATAKDARPTVVGAAVAFAVLCHAVLGLLLIPSLWIFRRNRRAALSLSAVAAGVPSALFVAGFVLARGAVSPRGWVQQLVPAETLGFVAPGLSAQDALRGLVVWQWYRSVPVMVETAARVIDALAVVALVWAVALVTWGIFSTLRGTDRTARIALGALAAFVPLWLLWDVGNPEHTVAAAPLFAVVAACGAQRLPRRVGAGALGVGFVLLLVVNGVGSAGFQSRPENGRVWVSAAFLAENASEDAVVLSLGTDPRLRLGLGYLSGRNVVDLTLTTRSARLADRPATDGLAYWLHRAGDADELWVTEDVVSPESGRWVEQLGIRRDQWRETVRRLDVVGTRELAPDGAVITEPFRLYRVRLRDTSPVAHAGS